MKLKAVSGILPALLLIGTLTLVVNVQPISAVESPYIAVVPDSLVDPSLMPGENFTISIGTDYNGSDIWGWQFTLAYNPSVLNGITVTNGDLITNATHPGQAVFLPGNFDNTVGRLSLTGGFFNFTEKPAPITSGPGTLANVTFEVVGTGDSLITIEDQTTLFGWTEGGYGDGYHIIDAYTDPGHIQHGYFDNRFQHDVAVVSVTAPTKATVGELVPISVEVANIGKSSEVVEVAVSYDGVPIETLQVTLLVGESETFLCIWNTTGVAQGSYTLNATATIRPKNETNTWTGDGVTKSFFTTGKPIVPDSEKIYVNQTLMTKPANYTINYEAGKITFATTPGVGAEIKATYLYPVDLFRTDNWKTTTILLVMHDVAVINLDAPANATIGHIVSINVTVANIGAFDEVANVAILYDSTYIDSQNVTLAKGVYKTISFSWNTTGIAEGIYTINATATILGDGDPTDNWKTTTILIVEHVRVHDVAVISVTPSPTSVVAGELVNIMVLVENQGTVNEDFDVTAYYDTIVIGTQIVINLPPGATTSVTFSWDTTGVPLGDYTITAVTSELPGETDTEDNTLQSEEIVTVSPVGVHDIAVVSATASPTEVTSGEFVTITGTVVNEGDFSEIFSLTVYYDSTMISAYNATLDAGGSTTWAFTWDTTAVPSGTYTIRAEAIVVEGEVDISDNMLVDGTVTVTSQQVPPLLSIKLCGEHDYAIMENVKIQLAALVKDAVTLEPVSDANVTVEIYDSDGVLWVSDMMVEKLAGTGIYEWESEGTIRQLRLAKGVHLVHAQASHQGGPTASDILEFHIDPPAGGTNQTLYHIAFTAVALVGLAGLILKRRQIANRLRKLKRHS